MTIKLPENWKSLINQYLNTATKAEYYDCSECSKNNDSVCSRCMDKIAKHFQHIAQHKLIRKLLHTLRYLLELIIDKFSESKFATKLNFLKSVTDDSTAINITDRSTVLLEEITSLHELLTESREAREAFDHIDGHQIVLSAIQKEYQDDDNEPTLLLCAKGIEILAQTSIRRDKVNTFLGRDRPFIQMITEMLQKHENDQLIGAICRLLCVFAMSVPLTIDNSVILESGTFEALVKVGLRMKETNNEPILELVMRALDFATLINIDNQIHLLYIDGTLELVTSLLTYNSGSPKWWERWPKFRRLVHQVCSSDDQSGRFFCFYPVRWKWVIRLWESRFYPFDPSAVCSSGNMMIVSDYLKGVLWFAWKDRFISRDELSVVVENTLVERLTTGYRPVRFTPTNVHDDPSIKFIFRTRLTKNINEFEYGDKSEGYSGDKFNWQHEFFNPYIEPSYPLWAAIQERSSRILSVLATDKFHYHEPSMNYFRETDIFGLLMNRHVDYLDLSLEIPREVRQAIQEHACATIAYVLDEGYSRRKESPEWKRLLIEASKYPCLLYKFEDTDPKLRTREVVYKKLVKLRSHWKGKIDHIVFPAVYFAILVFVFLLLNGFFKAWRESQKEDVRGNPFHWDESQRPTVPPPEKPLDELWDHLKANFTFTNFAEFFNRYSWKVCWELFCVIAYFIGLLIVWACFSSCCMGDYNEKPLWLLKTFKTRQFRREKVVKLDKAKIREYIGTKKDESRQSQQNTAYKDDFRKLINGYEYVDIQPRSTRTIDRYDYRCEQGISKPIVKSRYDPHYGYDVPVYWSDYSS